MTAGSPTAQVPSCPPGSHVLSEHEGDVVPPTDGAPNPTSVQQVTVTFADTGGADGVVGDHDYWHYVNGAAAVDASADPAVVEQTRQPAPGRLWPATGRITATVSSQSSGRPGTVSGFPRPVRGMRHQRRTRRLGSCASCTATRT